MTLSYQDIYQWKKDNVSYLDEDLQEQIYDLLDTINEETLRKNKELMKDRYKNNYQSKKRNKYSNNRKHNTLSHNNNNNNNQNNWREEKKVGLKSFLKNVDKFELGINMELNKISSKNIDIIVDSIKNKFIDVLSNDIVKELTNVEKYSDLNEKLNYIYTLGKLNVSQEFGLNKILQKYYDNQEKLWHNIINKLCYQENLVDLYLKFIHKLLLIKHTDIIDILEEKIIEKVLKLSNNSYHNGSEDDINKSRLQQVIKLLTNYLKKNNSSVIVSFHTYNKFKNELIEECIEFNKTQSYFQNKEIKLYQLLELSKDNTNIPYQSIFSSLGKFVKYFTDLNRKDKMNNLYDILLMSIYDNFKILNEILQWEPIDNMDIEKRVNFIVGVLEDNVKFIKGLDTDFYRDIECELDMIKKYKNIPISVKYRLFDCIDNFIATRNRR